MLNGVHAVIQPSVHGGAYVSVSVTTHEKPGECLFSREVLSKHLPEAKVQPSEREIRTWVNSMVRLVARTLEDDLYEQFKSTALGPDARRDTRPNG